jgi:glycosyltransferase involved in cell wall biosynthesis
VPTNPPTRCEVAVILPCYNVERYLQRALDSAFSQSFRDFQIYAVDDSSTDRTLPILESNSHRCTFVSQPHAGPAAARNRAIRMSNSPFVAFLDADDEWLRSKLERQIALLKQDPALGMVCSLCLLQEPGGEKPSAPASDTIPGSGNLFRHMVRNCFVLTPSVVLRRRCLEEVGLFNESLSVSEDFNLWLRIAARWKIAFLPEVLAIVHKRTGSLSTTIAPEERLRTGVAALEHVRANCPDLPPAEARALRHALAERFYFYGSYLLSSGAKSLSRRNLASALKLRPGYWQALVKLALGFLPARASLSALDLKKSFDSRWRARNSSPFAPKDASSI